jgi:hypothetical protein
MGVDENGSFESPLPCHLDRSMTAFGHAKWRDLQFAWRGIAAPGKLQVLTQSAPQTFCIALCNIQVSPLRRQKTPPPVEMTRYGWVRKELQLKVARRSLFLLLFFWLSFLAFSPMPPQTLCVSTNHALSILAHSLSGNCKQRTGESRFLATLGMTTRKATTRPTEDHPHG